MSALCINYDHESDFSKAITDAKSELSKRIEDYKNIDRRVNAIPSSTGNLSSCSYYIRKKNQQLHDKFDKLNTLGRQVDSFVDTVRETDKTVADRIKKDTKNFTKRTGIGKKSKSVWASVCEFFGNVWTGITDFAKDAWADIKQWYEDNKYWINIVVDVVLVVAAVVACIGTGGLSLAVGIFFAADAVFDLIYDGAAAYQYYHNHDEAAAERLAEKGGKDAFMFAGRWVDEKFGTDFFEGAMGVLYTGLSFCAVAYSFYKTGKQILKDLKLDKIKVKSLFNGNKNKIKWSSHFNKQNITNAVKHYFGFKDVRQADVMKLQYKKILGFKVGQTFIKTTGRARNILKINNLYKGGKKTYKKISTLYNNFKKGDFNPFVKTKKSVTSFFDSLKLVHSGGV